MTAPYFISWIIEAQVPEMIHAISQTELVFKIHENCSVVVAVLIFWGSLFHHVIAAVTAKAQSDVFVRCFQLHQ